jgi:NTP pyrophosphatase (non-canonical NTP hydrolase)
VELLLRRTVHLQDIYEANFSTQYALRTRQRFSLRIKQNAMTIEAAQQRVDAWINTTGVRYFSELTNMAILTEEVGEVARLMSRLYGDQSFKESDKHKELSDELADVLWVLMCIANQTGINLTEALEKNFEKKNIRDANRHRDNEKL